MSIGTLSHPIGRGKTRSSDPPGKSPTVPSTRPFAALPHDLRKDPNLRGRDKAILLAAALLEYARGKPSCFPSNRRLAEDLGCCPRTVQLALAALKRAGWIRVELGTDTPTGRRIVLAWREADCAPSSTPVACHPAQSRSPELRREGEERSPEPAATPTSGSPPPGGDGVGDAPSAEDLALWQSWADGPDATLARVGRGALALAGVVEPAVAPPENRCAIGAAPAPATPPRASGPPSGAPVASRPARQRRPGVAPDTTSREVVSGVAPPRRVQSPRQLLEGVLGRLQSPAIIPVSILRSP